MKRNYPLILIDKTRTVSHPYHHIAVMGETPLVIRVRLLKSLLDYEPTNAFVLHPLSKGGILFEVVNTKEDGAKIQNLIKKAAKKYLLGFRDENYKGKDLSLRNQIYQQRLTIEHNKRNFTKLVEQCDGQEDLAKYSIALAEATLESLYRLQELIEYGK